MHCVKSAPEVNIWEFRRVRKRGKIGAETLFWKQMFPSLRPQETFDTRAKFASRETKTFLNLFRNKLLPQQMFPPLHAEGTFRETMFPQK